MLNRIAQTPFENEYILNLRMSVYYQLWSSFDENIDAPIKPFLELSKPFSGAVHILQKEEFLVI